MRHRLVGAIAGTALALSAVAPAAAQPVAVGPFGSLIGIIVQLEDVLNDSVTDVIEVNINDSLNNVLQNALQNADIDVLNNVLQNADIDVEIEDITVVGDSIVVTVLGGDQIVLG